jgi:hypothetical protein
MTSMRNWILAAALALVSASQALAADAAAKVVMLTGKATALGAGGEVRSLAKEDPVYSGELITSGPGSYVNLRFADGAFFLLRPGTRFEIEHYSYVDPAQVARAKVTAPAAALATPPATVKTAFNGPTQEEVGLACAASQICKDCRASKNNHSKACNLCFIRVQNCKAVKKAFLASKKAAATQVATPATAPAETPAAAAPTAPVQVTTVAPETGETSRAFFRLLKGGFRSVSGLIGKANHDDYRVSTPVATIGIRGTRYGARLCQGECSDRDEILAKLRAAGRGARAGETILVTTVEEGQISLKTLTSEGLQSPGSTRLIGEDGSIIETDEPPSTERNDQDLNPESCGTE